MKALLVVALLVWSLGADAVTFDAIKFDVYRGDDNGDGHTDLYLRRKPLLVPIGSGIRTPAPIAIEESYLLLGDANGGFGTPVQTTIDYSSFAQETNVSFGDFNADGLGDVLVQGQNATDASVLLVGSAGAASLV